MPIREYECPTCGFRTERLEQTSDPNPLTCVRCRDEHRYYVEMLRVPSAAYPQFKGDGWTRPARYSPPTRGPKGDRS